MGFSAGSPAVAAEKASRNPLIGALVKCMAEADGDARLRCYDAAASALDEATAAGTVMVVDREDVRRARRSLFGFSLPKLPLFGGDNTQEEQPDEIEAKIRSVRSLGYGKWVIVLDGGARWQTTDTASFQQDPKSGDTIKIKKAAMGSYFLSVNGRRAVKGMRIG
jgi:hypothetical protein